jgi:hypothetical protein
MLPPTLLWMVTTQMSICPWEGHLLSQANLVFLSADRDVSQQEPGSVSVFW